MFIADFHIHSKYSRATSRDCVPEMLELWARRKGIHVMGTGDFTHPAWRAELGEKLVPAEEGLYVLKDDFRKAAAIAGEELRPRFIVSGEISSIYKKNGRVRKVHNLILLPGLEQAEQIALKLEAIGNLHSDGRPILGLDSRDLLEIVMDTCPEAIFIPAHIWTPHFSLYGAYSGFDDIMECFGDLTSQIYALETGLSSDPPMNWRLSALDNFTLVSNSDAHSPAKLGREANIFDTGLAYSCMRQALKNRSTNEFYGTIEFFPEEGKYHYDGHRACKVCWKPSATIAAGGVCPVCGGRITVGVLHRVEALADRQEGFIPPAAKHFESIVPLPEVIASSIGAAATGKKVRERYDHLLGSLGPEFFILREAALSDIEAAAGPCIAEGIRRLRHGKVVRHPGFDGEYGKIELIDKSEIGRLSGQQCLIDDLLLDDKNAGVGGSSATAPKLEKMMPAGEPAATLAAEACPAGDNRQARNAAASNLPYGLNEAQWQAVSSADPAIAVIAGPGTGKTKTLVCRIAYLVEKCGIQPSQVTAVTFTNKAAAEMRTRLTQLFGDKRIADAMTIGTFHSICLQILSKQRDGQGVSIIDEYGAVSIIEDLVKSMNLKISPRKAISRISLLKNGVLLPEQQEKTDVPAPLYDAYCARLQQYGMLDYDDILLEVLQQFADSSPGNAAGMSDSFSHLLVDEFQDINELQFRLIKEWSRSSESVFIIGDPDQSIYGFRGSDFRYFERFKEEFPGIRQVRLTQNYRSTPEVVAAAKAVIARKAAGEPSGSLAATRENGVKVRLITANNEFSEALFVTKEINRMVGGIDMLDTQTLPASRKKRNSGRHPRAFSDMAVLYRTNRQAEILEQCFLKEGIQYVVVGRDEFLSDPLVREAIAFFRFLLNPADIAALLVALKAKHIHLPDLGPKILERNAAGDSSATFFARAMEESQWPQEPGKYRDFIEMLKKYELIVHNTTPWKIIDAWISDNHLSGTASMEKLLNTSVMYDEMAALIQNLVLGRESDVVRSGSKSYVSDAVSLMTMHAAKGLEFPTVFIYGANDGMIPLRFHDADLNIDEERRLFYVGMTRARDELILLTAHNPSPFIADINETQLLRENASPPKQLAECKQGSLFD